MHIQNELVKTFLADVYAYHPYVTKFKIYHCQAEEVTFKCKTNFINSKTQHRQSKKFKVTPGQIISAMNTKISIHGTLEETSPGIWKTKSRDKYICSWMKTKYSTFRHFTITTPLLWEQKLRLLNI